MGRPSPIGGATVAAAARKGARPTRRSGIYTAAGSSKFAMPGKAAARVRDRKQTPFSGGPRAGRVFDVSLHGGKVVAMRQGEVVAVGETFAEVDTEVRERGLENDVILTRVPKTEDLVL